MVKAHKPTSGYLSVYKTYSRLAQHYYWPKMRSDVLNFVQKCVTYATHKVDQQGPKDMITSQPKVSPPWEMVSMDLIGPLPRSTRCNQYIFVIADYFSKFVLVFALRKASTDSKNSYMRQ